MGCKGDGLMPAKSTATYALGLCPSPLQESGGGVKEPGGLCDSLGGGQTSDPKSTLPTPVLRYP